LAAILLAVSALGTATPVNSQTTQKSPAKQQLASSIQELQRRIEAQRAAAASGDSNAVETFSRQVLALALQQMAALRSSEQHWRQAAELYRQSLALEEDQETRLALAGAAFYAGETDQALTELDRLLAADPRSAQAWNLKGKVLTARQDYGGAAEAFTRSLGIKRDVNVQFALGRALLNLKEKEKAAVVFTRMLDDYGDRAIWHVVFGGAYRDIDYPEDAIREFRRAIALDPNAPHVHVFLGLTLMEQNHGGATPEIEHEFAEEIRRYPDDYFGNYSMGVVQTQLGQIAESNQHLQVACKAQPASPDPWLILGLNAFKSNDYATAKPYLLKSVELTGKDEERNNYQMRRGYIALGRILMAEGKRDEAEQYFTKAKALGAKSMELSSEVIRSEMSESGRSSAPGVVPIVEPPRDPGAAVNQSTTIDPVDATPAPGAQLTSAELNELRVREKQLRVVLSTTYNDWGTANARQRDYTSALSHFQEAEKWDDSTSGLMRNLGLAALKLGNDAEAVRAFRAAVDRAPNDIQARSMLAITLFSGGQFAEAAKAFGAVGDAVYRDPRMAYGWAFSLARINDPQKAVEVLNKLTSQPLPKEMWMTSGDVYTQVGDYEDGLRCFRKAVELDPNTDRAHHFAGVALIRLGRPSEAIAELQAELKLTPNDPDTQYNLAYAFLGTSQKDEAMAILRTLVAEHPDHAQAQYQLGKTLLDEGQYQQAIEHLEAAAKYDPNHDYVHYQLQAAYRKVGRTADAERELAVYRKLKDQARDKGNPQPKQ
jgi:tetratricopeptide (TPR) repeat protein